VKFTAKIATIIKRKTIKNGRMCPLDTDATTKVNSGITPEWKKW